MEESNPFENEGLGYGPAFPIAIPDINIHVSQSHEVGGEGQVDCQLPQGRGLWRVWRAWVHPQSLQGHTLPLHFGKNWQELSLFSSAEDSSVLLRAG